MHIPLLLDNSFTSKYENKININLHMHLQENINFTVIEKQIMLFNFLL